MKPKPPITQFSGKHAFLSNFCPAPIWIDEMLFTSAEHAYQAAKTLDASERRKIQRLTTPSEAKRAGRTVTLRADWEEVKLDVMLDILRKKFSHTHQRQQLLDTGDRELIEGNWWGDTFWGVCKGEGENHLGRLLMQVRNEIRTGAL
jgi:ribA/ribD-fused uncharacterized protein